MKYIIEQYVIGEHRIELKAYMTFTSYDRAIGYYAQMCAIHQDRTTSLYDESGKLLKRN